MKNFVLGFAFYKGIDQIILIQKTKAGPQFGKCNGIGGSVEPHEKTFRDAMVREFKEETGIQSRKTSWIHFGRFGAPGWNVECFASLTACTDFTKVVPSSEGPIILGKIGDLRGPLFMPNLRWLVPMAAGALEGCAESFFDIRYQS